VAVIFGEIRGNASDVVLGAAVPDGLPKDVIPCANNGADIGFQFSGIDFRRLAAGAADDEMHARQNTFRKGGIVGRKTPLEGRLQIGADFLAYSRIVA